MMIVMMSKYQKQLDIPSRIHMLEGNMNRLTDPVTLKGAGFFIADYKIAEDFYTDPYKTP
jgi:hypothetical protein